MFVELNDGISYRTPVLLNKALEIIERLPTSMEYEDNYIIFENDKQQNLRFKRIFNNQWELELSNYHEGMAPKYLCFKLFSTNMVKIIVINFFKGDYLGERIGGLSKELCIKRLNEIVNELRSRMKNQLFCKYCRNKIIRINLNCDYCNTEFDFSVFSFKLL